MNTINIFKKFSLFVLVIVLFLGCGGNFVKSNIMKPASPLNSVNNDKALVTFLMSTTMANPFPTFQFEFNVWDGEKFIGALSRYTYFQYIADPGDHIFLARGGNSSFLKANLQAGKKYYVFVNLRIKPFYQKVSFEPVTRYDQQLITELQWYLNDMKPISLMEEQCNNYQKERIDAVKKEINIFKTSKYDYSTLDLHDGI
jgi:hypothetical protein